MAFNESDGLFWTWVGPVIWMALLLSIVSGKADGSGEIEAFEPVSRPRVEIEETRSSRLPEALTLHASVDCVEPVEDGA